MKLFVCLLVVASVLNSAPVTTIDALVADTVANNLELKFYEGEIAAARAGRQTAGLLPYPELGADLGRKSATALDGTSLGDGPAWSVSVKQTFEWPGRLNLRKSIANSDVELAELGLARFRAALAARARVLAFDLYAAQGQAAATREVAERFEALLDVRSRRPDAATGDAHHRSDRPHAPASRIRGRDVHPLGPAGAEPAPGSAPADADPDGTGEARL